ncbi:hypothetical protein LEN26_009677 [Aphanomyces euteiches]|nr:hypothetical protein AeMF1_015082 [Aphanomyces euteiches]KAH9124642.1 hypothetical protein LEN26_009677 [Aphanomyces euteiches]KAH9165198.1 hypothetical protein AeNC1_018562 [Aphanomyces euteiches]
MRRVSCHVPRRDLVQAVRQGVGEGLGGKCKKEEMKHKVNQIATNCAGLSAAVGIALACSSVSQGAVVVGGVTTSIMTLKSQLDSYMEVRCARLVHAASGVAKLKKAMPKINAVNAFKKAKKSRPAADVRIPISRRWTH